MAQEAGTTEPEGTTPEEQETTAPPTGEGKPETFERSYVEQLRGEAAGYRRELREAQERLKTFEDEGKSELEKLTERVSQAESLAGTASSEAARLRVAIKKGLTESQAKRLVGATEEELEADAEELLKTFGATTEDEEEGQGPASGTPRERLKPGAAPAAEPDETDPAKLAAMVRRPFQ